MCPQKQHQVEKSAFNSYLIHIFGSKWWMHKFIQFPLTSAAQSVKELQDLLEAWEEYKDSDEHKQAVLSIEKQRDQQTKPPTWDGREG